MFAGLEEEEDETTQYIDIATPEKKTIPEVVTNEEDLQVAEHDQEEDAENADQDAPIPARK